MNKELVSRFVVSERTTEIKVPMRSPFDCKTMNYVELRNMIDATLEKSRNFSPDKELHFEDQQEAEAQFYSLVEKAEGLTRYYDSNGLMLVYECFIEEVKGYFDEDGEFDFEEVGSYYGCYTEPLERGFEFYANKYGEKFETLEDAINDTIDISNFRDDFSSLDSLEIIKYRISPEPLPDSFYKQVDSYDKSDIAKHIAKTKDSYYYSKLEGEVDLDVFIKSLECKKHDERGDR